MSSAVTERGHRRDRWLTVAIVVITTVLIGYNIVMFYGQSYFLTGKKVETLPLADPRGGAERPVVVPSGAVIVNFWATWCSSCVAELPTLKEYASKFHIIGVLKGPVRADRLEEMALPWKNLVGPDALFSEFMVAGVPMTIFLRDNVVVAVHSGPVTRAVLDRWLSGAH